MEIAEEVFQVGTPPSTIQHSKYRQARNGVSRAFDFCNANVGEWCKLFNYPYNDERPQVNASSASRSRLKVMRDYGDNHHTEWECFAYHDQELCAYIVWGRISKKEEE